ncbi:MAG: chromosome segregation protein ScpA [Planctomycetes bacterium]|nr:chromosome segregation protein ScpA [Planctomycetota bacterium]
MSQYRVNLDIFAGPLDLLLYLVRKDEVDIYDIPIKTVTGEYIKYIEMLKLFDIELAGDFLVMAATLMEIKSVMLLPRVEEESDEEAESTDPRAELVRQLLEYKKFKDAANMLDDSAAVRKQRFTRPDAIISKLKPQEEPELDLDEVSIWTLLEAFDAIMQETGNYQNFEHIHDDTSIDFYQIEILHRLQTEGPRTFAELFADKTDKLQMIGVLLGLLELMKSELIWAEQSEYVGEIRIRAKTEVPAEKAVQDAIYKNQEEEALAQQNAAAQQSKNAEKSDEGFLPESSSEIDKVDTLEEITPPIAIAELPAIEQDGQILPVDSALEQEKSE